MKRILLTGDWHCGHKYGIAALAECHNRHQRKGAEFVREAIEALKPIDFIVNNGDAIDGDGKKNGGVELITSDRNEQVKMAIRFCDWLQEINGQKMIYHATYGTPYHVGVQENFEENIAEKFPIPSGKKNIGDTLFLDIEGVGFQFRHETGGAGSPTMRGSALKREALWRVLKEEVNYHEAKVLVRSHVHFFNRDEYFFGKTLQILPALQMWSSYGDRRCNGMVDFGVVAVDVDNGKIIKWHDYFISDAIVTEPYFKY